MGVGGLTPTRRLVTLESFEKQCFLTEREDIGKINNTSFCRQSTEIFSLVMTNLTFETQYAILCAEMFFLQLSVDSQYPILANSYDKLTFLVSLLRYFE